MKWVLAILSLLLVPVLSEEALWASTNWPELSASAPTAPIADLSMSSTLEPLIDSALAQATAELEPLALKEQHHTFEKKVGFFTIKAEAHLTQGKLHGLSRIRRLTPIKEQENEQEYVLDLDVGVNHLSAEYRARLKISGMSKTGAIQASATGLKLNLVLVITQSGLFLHELRLRPGYNVNVSLNDFGAFGWVVRLLRKRIDDALENKLDKYVSGKLKQKVQKKLDEFNKENF